MARPAKETAQAKQIRRAKQLLAGGSVSRDDSDDELGLEDHPWEYIYSEDGSEIVGARMGNFRCDLGDAVLLKAEGTKEAWVGLICGFNDIKADDETDTDEDEKAAYFMWFSTEKEIRNKTKKRTDNLTVGLERIFTLFGGLTCDSMNYTSVRPGTGTHWRQLMAKQPSFLSLISKLNGLL